MTSPSRQGHQLTAQHTSEPAVYLYNFCVMHQNMCPYTGLTYLHIPDGSISKCTEWRPLDAGGWEYDRFHGAGTSSPPHWQQVKEQAPKPVGWMMCFLLMTFVPVQKLCVNKFMCINALLYEVFFLWLTNCVLLSDDNSLIPGCVWLLALVLNNTLILGIWCSTIPHFPLCFFPWTFFHNIGFNMVPSDPFKSQLATHLDIL